MKVPFEARCTIDAGGRTTILTSMREALGVEPGASAITVPEPSSNG